MSGANAVQKQSLAGVLQNRYFFNRMFFNIWMVLLRLVFLDNEYSSEVFQTLLAVPHFKLHGKARSSRPEVFRKKGVFENFTNQRCFPVNFAKFSRSTFFLEHSGGCFWKAKSRSSYPEVFCKKGVFENFASQRCFPVNFAKFSRTSFFIEHLRWLLLKC